MSKKDEPYVIQVVPAPSLRPAPSLEAFNQAAAAHLDEGRPGPVKCAFCRGHGIHPMSDYVVWLPCPSCGGTGRGVPSLVSPPAEPSRRSRGPRKVDWEM